MSSGTEGSKYSITSSGIYLHHLSDLLLGWLFLRQRLMLLSIFLKMATRSARFPFYQFSNLAEDSVSFPKVPAKVPTRDLTQLRLKAHPSPDSSH